MFAAEANSWNRPVIDDHAHVWQSQPCRSIDEREVLQNLTSAKAEERQDTGPNGKRNFRMCSLTGS